jgi:hypothetical protein
MKTIITFLFLFLSVALSFGSVKRIPITKANQAEAQIKFAVRITPDKQQAEHCLVELGLPAGQLELAELWKIYLWSLNGNKTILAAPLDLSYAEDQTITVRFHGHVDTVSQSLIAIRCGQHAPLSETIYQIDLGSYLKRSDQSDVR